MSAEEGLRKYLKKRGYEYIDAGNSKEGLGNYLSECCHNYPNSDSNQNQQQTTQSSQNQQPSTPIIHIEQKSGLDFWDIIFLSWLWGRGGNTTIIYNYAPSSDRRSNESDGRVLGPCIAAFCLIFATVMSYCLLAYAAYKIKNAKLENNKYSVPSAVRFGVFSFSVSATLILLLSGMIVPHLEHAMGISSEAFTGFQVIAGLNAVIFGLGAVLFFYLAIDKANIKASIDREVDLIIDYNMYSPDYSTSNSQHRERQFPQREQYQAIPGQFFTSHLTQSNQQYPPSAPPPSYEQSEYGENTQYFAPRNL